MKGARLGLRRPSATWQMTDIGSGDGRQGAHDGSGWVMLVPAVRAQEAGP
jgi:hypothetical protein